MILLGDNALRAKAWALQKMWVLINDSMWKNNPKALSAKTQEFGSKKILMTSIRFVGSASKGVLESSGVHREEVNCMGVP
jgi:hypothetical protein